MYICSVAVIYLLESLSVACHFASGRLSSQVHDDDVQMHELHVELLELLGEICPSADLRAYVTGL